MSQVSQINSEEDGNTSSSSSSLRSRHWCFTFNNPPNKHKEFLVSLSQHFSKIVFQLEIGESKTPHYQGYCYNKNQKRFNTLKKINKNIHWEKCRNPKASIQYCQKLIGRIKGPWCLGLPKPLKIISHLRDFQLKILMDINIQIATNDDRTINWYFDKIGGIGKTKLAKLICSKYNALYCSGKGNDIKHMIIEHFKKNELNKDNLIIIFDISRSIENYISYDAIEQIKNGIFMSGKYESSMVMFNSPIILCFANFEPDRSKLSMDRWKVQDLTGPVV